LAAFTDQGWNGFENEFAALYPTEGAAREQLKADLLREPVFQSQKRLMDWYETNRIRFAKAAPSYSTSYASDTTATAMLRADGIYHSVAGTSQRYLRFHPDGTVLMTSGFRVVNGRQGLPSVYRPGSPRSSVSASGLRPGEQVLIATQSRWDTGKFVIDGGHLSFSIGSKDGILDCDGNIRASYIDLHWKNRGTGDNGATAFSFVFVPLVDLFHVPIP
jgi:hypothetical protein